MTSPSPASPQLLLAIALSAALGAAIGVVRQWTDWTRDQRTVDFGGARTYALRAVLGCLGASLADASPFLLVVLLAAIAAHEIFVAGHMARRRIGGTSFVAVLLTVLVGALVASGENAAAVLVASITSITLGIKRPIHRWTEAFTKDDIRAGLQFAAVTGVILPLVPDRTFGPDAAINPYAIWLMVVFISAIGFAGYVAMRLLGPRAGILWTSLFGGIASSTAIALAFSRRSAETEDVSVPCAVGIVVASTIMLVRVVGIIAVISQPLAVAVAEPYALMAAPAMIWVGIIWYLHRKEQRDPGTPAVRNPLNLGTALKFGALYALVTFFVTLVRHHWQAGLLPLSFVSALTNMDAITLSLAHGQSQSLEPTVHALVLAAIANTLVKIVMVLILASPLVRRLVCVALGLTVMAGIVALIWL